MRSRIFSSALGAACLLAPAAAFAAPPPDQLWIDLPDTIFMTPSDDPALDADGDWLKDDAENRLADAWRPYFIFDEKEADSPASLQWFEPVVIYQVRPTSWDWPRRIQIKWGFLWRYDGGFRGAYHGAESHPGDTQGGYYDLSSWDGASWHLDQVNLWDDVPTVSSDDGRVEWTSPRATYFGEMPNRPSPRVHCSAGKHHQFTSFLACENSDEYTFSNEDCDGGDERFADLYWRFGRFHNIGEPEAAHHEAPFVNDLSSYYAGEEVWVAHHTCEGKATFTGGMDGCSTDTDAVFELFHRTPSPAPYPRVDTSWDRYAYWTKVSGLSGTNPISTAVSGGREWIFQPSAGGALQARADHTSPYLVGMAGYDLSGFVVGETAATARSPGQLDLFVRSSNGSVWTKSHNDGTSSFWPSQANYHPLGGASLADAPSAASWGTNAIDVFGRNDAGNVVHWKWRNSPWTSAENLGGAVTGKVASVARKSGVVDIFVRDAGTGQLCTKSLSETGSWRFDWYSYTWTWVTTESWSPSTTGWTCFADAVIAGSPTVVSTGPNRLDVFGRTGDGAILHKVFDTSWHPATRLSSWYDPEVQGDIAATARAPGVVDIAVVDKDGWVFVNTLSGSTWSGYSWLAGNMAQVKIASRSSSSVEVVALGADLSVYRKTGDGTTWY